MLKKGDKVGIVCCSNGQKKGYKEKIDMLNATLQDIGLCPVMSACIYEMDNVYRRTAKERAGCLMDFYRDKEIKAIFDISGGDIANEILPYLDFDIIAKSDKEFWGYSDLTTIINAIYAKTQNSSVLYQVRNLLYQDSGKRKYESEQSLFAKKRISVFEQSVMEGKTTLFDFPYRFVRGTKLEGVVLGGNIRCLLKLAGTAYFPDMTDKILLLEAMSGEMPQMTTYLSQLQQMGVFDKVNGIFLGTFTKYEENPDNPPIEELVMKFVPENLPIVKTDYIGHGSDSKAVRIGEELCLQ